MDHMVVNSTNHIRVKENKHLKQNLVKNHYHQVFQILYVLKNQCEIKFDQQTHTFTQDTLAFIPPFSNHSIISDQNMTMLVLEFDVEKLDSQLKYLLSEYNLTDPALIALNIFEAGEVRQLLRRMLYEQSQGQLVNLLAMKIYLSQLLLILIKSTNDPIIKNANVLRAERLRKYIDTHYFENLNSNGISRKIGISPRHVNNIFKELYDMTPMQYLNKVRMETAKKMLIETDNDIVSICFEIGFESLSTFYRAFKNYTNFSPKKFRIAYQETVKEDKRSHDH